MHFATACTRRRLSVYPRGEASAPGYVSIFLQAPGAGVSPINTYPAAAFSLIVINQVNASRSIRVGEGE